MIISASNEITTKEIEKNSVVLLVSKDGKTFKILKHRNLPNNEIHPISMLQHVLMAGKETV